MENNDQNMNSHRHVWELPLGTCVLIGGIALIGSAAYIVGALLSKVNFNNVNSGVHTGDIIDSLTLTERRAIIDSLIKIGSS